MQVINYAIILSSIYIYFLQLHYLQGNSTKEAMRKSEIKKIAVVTLIIIQAMILCVVIVFNDLLESRNFQDHYKSILILVSLAFKVFTDFYVFIHFKIAL